MGLPPVAQSVGAVSPSPPGAATGQRALRRIPDALLEYEARPSSRVVAVTTTAGSSPKPVGSSASFPAAITAMAPLLQA